MIDIQKKLDVKTWLDVMTWFIKKLEANLRLII